jgi:hypothetical protein
MLQTLFMKTIKKVALLSLSTFIAFSARCQPIASSNAVGYINLTIYAGDNLIANQLDDTVGNTLDDIFATGPGDLLTGSTFTEWDPTSDQLLPASVFNGTSWSINYGLSPNGVGGVLNSPANTTVTFVGDVVNFNIQPGGGYTFVPPLLGPGTYLLAMAAPLTGTFEQVIGSDPIAGDSVETLDASTQTYSTTTFNGTTWNNGTPSLAVDEAAYFDLVVPEPSMFALTGLGAGILLICRRAQFIKWL